MPRVRRYDKRRHGPFNLYDLHLAGPDCDGLVERYGSLEAVQERYEELLERGDLVGKRHDCEAFWRLNAPEELHEVPVRDPRLFESHPEIFAAQERELEAFNERRKAWLEENGYA